MSPGTLSQILPDAAEALGLDPVLHRPQVIKQINRARRILYLFEDGREAFFKTEGEVVSLSYQYSRDRSGVYCAITLPPEIEVIDILRSIVITPCRS